MTADDAEKIAREAQDAFPGYRVYLHYTEATLEPSIVITSTSAFGKATLARLLDFASNRGLSLRVGGDGPNFHSATMRTK